MPALLFDSIRISFRINGPYSAIQRELEPEAGLVAIRHIQRKSKREHRTTQARRAAGAKPITTRSQFLAVAHQRCWRSVIRKGSTFRNQRNSGAA